MAQYIGLIDGETGVYGIVVPDFPGCTAMGHTVEEVLQNAADAVRDWADDARASGENVPPPRPIEALRKDAEVVDALAGGAVLAPVPVP
jgi:predicted RNase H-like HicB family nuclease